MKKANTKWRSAHARKHKFNHTTYEAFFGWLSCNPKWTSGVPGDDAYTLPHHIVDALPSATKAEEDLSEYADILADY